jgi:hypothetical protein
MAKTYGKLSDFELTEEGVEIDIMRIVNGQKVYFPAVIKDRPNRDFDAFTVEHMSSCKTEAERQDMLTKGLAYHVVVSIGEGKEQIKGREKLYKYLRSERGYFFRGEILLASQDVAAYKRQKVAEVKKT